MPSRDIKDLIPELQPLAAAFLVEVAKELPPDVEVRITCTYRSQQEQDQIYAQGRTTPGKIVTWARNSEHTTRRAFDFGLFRHGCYLSGNNALDLEMYDHVGSIGKQLGLVWGGDFRHKDRMHFQLGG